MNEAVDEFLRTTYPHLEHAYLRPASPVPSVVEVLDDDNQVSIGVLDLCTSADLLSSR
jgi:hypothetical protein